MSDASLPSKPIGPKRPGFSRWRNRLVASRGFQRWASRFPLTRGIAKREGEALFDLVAGFAHSQALHALVDLRVLHLLADGPMTVAEIGAIAQVPKPRMAVLLQAGAALGLLKRKRDGKFALAQRGAALLGVPGLEAMILHHLVLYRDLSDPTAFFRGETDPDLARFWPYVFGAAGDVDPEVAERYSALMADSQGLVAEETLRHVSFKDTVHLLDVGGGSGAFLAAVAKENPKMRGTLFDLPEVAPSAGARFAEANLSDRIAVHPGSFRSDPLPQGADTISLVRVLYDHGDETVKALLAKVHDALPDGGRLVVSEPMSGGATPDKAGDAYFALYTLAMGTGTTRSAARISELLAEVGFASIQNPRTHRPFVTSVVTARRQS